MTAGSTITGPYQIELQGVNMDGVNPCPSSGLVISKWLSGMGVPKLRNNDKLRPQASGVFTSPRYLPQRPMTWGVVARASDAAGVQTALVNLARAFAPIPDLAASLTVPLVFTLSDGTVQYLVNGTPERSDVLYDTLIGTYQRPTGSDAHGGPFTDPVICEFTASDPLIYENTLHSLTAGLGTSSGGLGMPFGMPFGFGVSTPGQVLATNSGNVPSYPVLVFTAGGSGLSGITVTKQITGEQWSITLAMVAGDTLIVDMSTHTVLLNGSASRANVVNRPPSIWFSLDPASATTPNGINTISWQATGAGSTMQVQWRSAFLI